MNLPQLQGPGAKKIEIEHVPDGTGFSGSDEEPAGPAEEAGAESVKKEEPMEFDPEFPFGTPAAIDWNEIDAPGRDMLKELNLRPWIKSTEYCSGHPLDRPVDEPSKLYPYVTGENVYEEIANLDMAYIRGLVNDTYFRHRKTELRALGATRFYLNVNVYDNAIFSEWIRLLAALVAAATNSGLYPLIVRENPLRPGKNVSLVWDYWTAEERDMIHHLVMVSLNHFPV
jgi:hypothetical protein